MVLMLLALMGCGTTVFNEPVPPTDTGDGLGSQIGEEDCMGNTIEVKLVSASGAALSGTVSWSAPDQPSGEGVSCVDTCTIWDAEPDVTYTIEAGVEGGTPYEQTVRLTEDDLVDPGEESECVPYYTTTVEFVF